SGILDHLQQLPGDHQVQHLAAVCDGGLSTRAGHCRARPGSQVMAGRRLLVALLPLALAACATTGTASKDKPPPPGNKVLPKPAAAHAPKTSPYAAATEDLSTRGNYVAGGLYRPGVADTAPDDIP